LRGKVYKKLFGLLISVEIALCAGTLCHAETAAGANARTVGTAIILSLGFTKSWEDLVFVHGSNAELARV
jgi:hypothetical protein